MLTSKERDIMPELYSPAKMIRVKCKYLRNNGYSKIQLENFMGLSNGASDSECAFNDYRVWILLHYRMS